MLFFTLPASLLDRASSDHADINYPFRSQYPKQLLDVCIRHVFLGALCFLSLLFNFCTQLIFRLGAFPIFSVLELDWHAMGTLC